MNPILKQTALVIFLGAILLVFSASGTKDGGTQRGYRSVIRYNDGFLASGSDGRMDMISESGKILKSLTFPGEEFNCLFTDDKIIIAAGDKGVLRISGDGEIFRKIETGSVRNINSLTIFNGTIICGADDGIIIAGDTRVLFSEQKLKVKGSIVSVSSSATDCYGVTDKGEIIHSKDAIQWDILDYNQVYSGYYKPCSFTSVCVTLNRIAIAGRQDDGSPVVTFSSRGNVWTERILSYDDDKGFRDFLTEVPNSILYHEAEDQYIIACNSGTIILLPSCSQCNRVTKISEKDLKCLSLNGDKILVAGDDFFVTIMNIGW